MQQKQFSIFSLIEMVDIIIAEEELVETDYSALVSIEGKPWMWTASNFSYYPYRDGVFNGTTSIVYQINQ